MAFSKRSVPAALPLVSYSAPSPQLVNLSQQQEHALFALKDEDDRDICAYIRFAASTGRDLQPLNSHAVLSKEKIHAIEALKSCPVDILLAWLQKTRHSRSLPAVSPTTAPNYMRSSSSGDSRHGPLHIANTTWSDSGNLPKFIPPWTCTVCPKPTTYQNVSEWRRHEREHVFSYKCGLCSAAESEDEQGATRQRAGLSCKIYICKRKVLMVDHLSRDHALHDRAQGHSMAKSWLVNSGKQAWSCGFCARVFSAFEDRLKHIENGHFKVHHDARNWDGSKVIMGLLHQPGVKEAWEDLIASKHLHDSSDLIWENPALDELQLLLEMGPSTGQSAASLAAAAYDAARPRTSLNQLATTGFSGTSDTSSGYFNTPSHPHGIVTPFSSLTAGFQQPAIKIDPMLAGSDFQDFSSTGQGYAPSPTFGGAENVSFSPSNPNWDPWNDNSTRSPDPWP